jgi:hypothetical protein
VPGIGVGCTVEYTQAGSVGGHTTPPHGFPGTYVPIVETDSYNQPEASYVGSNSQVLPAYCRSIMGLQ